MGTVYLDLAGVQSTTSTGANGYYYLLEPGGTLTFSPTAVLAYTGTATTATGAILTTLTSASSTGLDIWGNTLIAPHHGDDPLNRA